MFWGLRQDIDHRHSIVCHNGYIDEQTVPRKLKTRFNNYSLKPFYYIFHGLLTKTSTLLVASQKRPIKIHRKWIVKHTNFPVVGALPIRHRTRLLLESPEESTDFNVILKPRYLPSSNSYVRFKLFYLIYIFILAYSKPFSPVAARLYSTPTSLRHRFLWAYGLL